MWLNWHRSASSKITHAYTFSNTMDYLISVVVSRLINITYHFSNSGHRRVTSCAIH